MFLKLKTYKELFLLMFAMPSPCVPFSFATPSLATFCHDLHVSAATVSGDASPMEGLEEATATSEGTHPGGGVPQQKPEGAPRSPGAADLMLAASCTPAVDANGEGKRPPKGDLPVASEDEDVMRAIYMDNMLAALREAGVDIDKLGAATPEGCQGQDTGTGDVLAAMRQLIEAAFQEDLARRRALERALAQAKEEAMALSTTEVAVNQAWGRMPGDSTPVAANSVPSMAVEAGALPRAKTAMQGGDRGVAGGSCEGDSGGNGDQSKASVEEGTRMGASAAPAGDPRVEAGGGDVTGGHSEAGAVAPRSGADASGGGVTVNTTTMESDPALVAGESRPRARLALNDNGWTEDSVDSGSGDEDEADFEEDEEEEEDDEEGETGERGRGGAKRGATADQYVAGDFGKVSAALREEVKRKYRDVVLALNAEFMCKRKKAKLPKEGTGILKQWWFVNFTNPYPTEKEKARLGEQTGLSRTQINNWFINQRKRHWQRLFTPALETATNAAASISNLAAHKRQQTTAATRAAPAATANPAASQGNLFAGRGPAASIADTQNPQAQARHHHHHQHIGSDLPSLPSLPGNAAATAGAHAASPSFLMGSGPHGLSGPDVSMASASAMLAQRQGAHPLGSFFLQDSTPQGHPQQGSGSGYQQGGAYPLAQRVQGGGYGGVPSGDEEEEDDDDMDGKLLSMPTGASNNNAREFLATGRLLSGSAALPSHAEAMMGAGGPSCAAMREVGQVGHYTGEVGMVGRYTDGGAPGTQSLLGYQAMVANAAAQQQQQEQGRAVGRAARRPLVWGLQRDSEQGVHEQGGN
eukprot:jgi/Mesvir1/27356/Mv07167-RA.1